MTAFIIVAIVLVLWALESRRHFRRANLLFKVRQFLCAADVAFDNGVTAPDGKREADAWASDLVDEIDEELRLPRSR